jgi:hypothetical protein
LLRDQFQVLRCLIDLLLMLLLLLALLPSLQLLIYKSCYMNLSNIIQQMQHTMTHSQRTTSVNHGCAACADTLLPVATAGRIARYIYGGAALHPTQNLPVQSVARYDLQTGHMQLWSKGSHYFMGEPQFIPRDKSDDPGLNPLEQRRTSHAGSHVHDLAAQASNTSSSSVGHVDGVAAGIREDNGWILSVGFDAQLQRSELVLLDAADIEAGPIAVLPLASPVGYGIHGTWVPAYYGP